MFGEVSVLLVIAIVWAHFIGDFILQTDRMAINKASSLQALSMHVVVYGVALLPLGARYAYLNAGCHFIVDFFTSKGTRWAHNAGKRHLFFVIIGLDQALHFTCLYTLYKYLNPFSV